MGLSFRFPKLNLGGIMPKKVSDVLSGGVNTLKKGVTDSFKDILAGKASGLVDRALNSLPGHKSNAPEGNANALANLTNSPSYQLPRGASAQAARSKGKTAAAAAGISPALMIAGGVGVLALVGFAFVAGRK